MSLEQKKPREQMILKLIKTEGEYDVLKCLKVLNSRKKKNERTFSHKN